MNGNVRKARKKLFSILLSLAMLITMMPMMTMTAYGITSISPSVMNVTATPNEVAPGGTVTISTRIVFSDGGGTEALAAIKTNNPTVEIKKDSSDGEILGEVDLKSLTPTISGSDATYEISKEVTIPATATVGSSISIYVCYDGFSNPPIMCESHSMSTQVTIVSGSVDPTKYWSELVKAAKKERSEGLEDVFTITDSGDTRTIKLLSDMVQTNDDYALVIPATGKLIVDLNGHTITSTSMTGSAGGYIFKKKTDSTASLEVTSSAATRGKISTDWTAMVLGEGEGKVNISNIDVEYGHVCALLDYDKLTEATMTNCDIKGTVENGVRNCLLEFDNVPQIQMTNCKITDTKFKKNEDWVSKTVIDCVEDVDVYEAKGTRSNLILEDCELTDNIIVGTEEDDPLATLTCNEYVNVVLKGNTKLSDKASGECTFHQNSYTFNRDDGNPESYKWMQIDLSDFTGNLNLLWKTYYSDRDWLEEKIFATGKKPNLTPVVTGLTSADDSRLTFAESTTNCAIPTVSKDDSGNTYSAYLVPKAVKVAKSDDGKSINCDYATKPGLTPTVQWYKAPYDSDKVEDDSSNRICMTAEDAWFELHGEHSPCYSEDKDEEKSKWDDATSKMGLPISLYNLTGKCEDGVWDVFDSSVMKFGLTLKLKKGESLEGDLIAGETVAFGEEVMPQGLNLGMLFDGDTDGELIFNIDSEGHVSGEATDDGIYTIMTMGADPGIEFGFKNVQVSKLNTESKRAISGATSTTLNNVLTGYAYMCELTFPDVNGISKPKLATTWVDAKGAVMYEIFNEAPESKKDDNNGYISVSGGAAEGNMVEVTVTPNTGYELDTLTCTQATGNAVVPVTKDDTTGKWKFTMPADEVTVQATFALNPSLHWEEFTKAVARTRSDSLADVFTVSDSGTTRTITLQSDIEVAAEDSKEAQVPETGKTIVDLNGHTITGNANLMTGIANSLFKVMKDVDLEIKSSGGTRGKINGTRKAIYADSTGKISVSDIDFTYSKMWSELMDLRKSSEATFTNCDIEGTVENGTYDRLLYFTNVPTLKMKNCKIKDAKINGDDQTVIRCNYSYSKYQEVNHDMDFILEDCEITDNIISGEDETIDPSSTLHLSDFVKVTLKGNTKICDKTSGKCSVYTRMSDTSDEYPDFYKQPTFDLKDFSGTLDLSWKYSERMSSILGKKVEGEMPDIPPAVTGLTGTNDSRLKITEYPSTYVVPTISKDASGDGYSAYLLPKTAQSTMNNAKTSISCKYPKVPGLTPQLQWYRAPYYVDEINDASNVRVFETVEDVYYDLKGEHSSYYSDNKDEEKENWEDEIGFYKTVSECENGVWTASENSYTFALKLKEGEMLECDLDADETFEAEDIESEGLSIGNYILGKDMVSVGLTMVDDHHMVGVAPADSTYVFMFVCEDIDELKISNVKISGVNATSKKAITGATTATLDSNIKAGYGYMCELTYPDFYDISKPSMSTSAVGEAGTPICNITNETAKDKKDINNGYIIVDDEGAVGSKVSVKVIPNPGYGLDKITCTPAEGSAPTVTKNGKVYEFEMPDSDVTLSATFKEEGLPIHQITIANCEHGKIRATVNGAEVQESKEYYEVCLSVMPDDGYELDKLIVKDKDGDDISVKNNKFIMPESDVTVSATFKEASEMTMLMQFVINCFDITPKAAMTNNGVNLIWNSIGAATGYEVYGEDAKGDYVLLTTTTENAAKVATCPSYKVRMMVDFKGTTLFGKYSDPVKIKLGATKILQLKSKKRKTMTVKFAPVAGAQTYQILYKVGKKSKVVGTSRTAAVIKKLKSKKKYSVYVRGTYAAGPINLVGPWSAAKKVKIK